MPKFNPEEILNIEADKEISCIPRELAKELIRKMKNKISAEHIRAAVSVLNCKKFLPNQIVYVFLERIFYDNFYLLRKHTSHAKISLSQINVELQKEIRSPLRVFLNNTSISKGKAGNHYVGKNFKGMDSLLEINAALSFYEELRAWVKTECEELKKELLETVPDQTTQETGEVVYYVPSQFVWSPQILWQPPLTTYLSDIQQSEEPTNIQWPQYRQS